MIYETGENERMYLFLFQNMQEERNVQNKESLA